MARLPEILWIGGSVCAGKSSIARQLANRHAAATYHYDDHERAHRARLGLKASPDYNDLWLRATPDEIAERRYRSWRRRFELVMDDLSNLASPGVVIAEGIGLLPPLVAPQVADRRQAVWLIASSTFLPWARRRRGMASPALTDDPARAERNIIASDLLIAARVAEEARAAELAVVDVDRDTGLQAVASSVAERFERFLPS